MKKLLKIIYLLLIPFYSTFGLGQIGVSIHDTTLVVGDMIIVPVYIDSSLTGEGVSSYNFQLSFNENYFVVDSAFVDGTLTEGWGTFAYSTNTADRISVAAAGSTDLDGKGILVNLRIRAIKRGNTNLSFTDTTYNYFNEGSPRVVLNSGRINVLDKATIKVNPDSELLTMDDTKQFSVSYGTPPYLWSVTNSSVASIDENGLLTANSKGSTRVVAQDANGIIDTNNIVEIRAFRLSTRDTSHYQGQTVDIPIYTTDLTGLNYTSGEFTLEINENVLTPLEIITSGTLLSGYTTPSFGFNSGKLKIAFAGDTPISGAGILMIVRYQITSENTTDTYLTFSDLLFNETDLGNGVRSYFNNLPLATLGISPTTESLLAGETLQFTASNGTAPYTWSVSNSSLASIDSNGLLTATNGGVVVVSAEDSFGGTGNSGNINLYDTQVTIPDTTADIGGVIEIPFYMGNLSSSHSILSIQTEILFDSSKIKFDQVVTEGTSTANWSFSANNLGNKVIIGGANTTGFNNSGTILKVKFIVSPTVSVGNYSNITLNNFLFNEGSPNAKLNNGRITIATGSAPNAPSSLSALPTGNTQVSLEWTDNSNNESGFKIERKIGAAGTWGQIATVSQNIETYINSGLTLGTNYLYRVRAFNNIGDSDYSNEASATTSLGTPNAPTNLSAILDAVDSSGTIVISWIDNADNEMGFYLNRKQDSNDWIEIAPPPPNTTSYIDSGLVDGTKYFYQIFAWNNNGNSSFSNIDSAITIMNPPTNLVAENPQTNTVVLTWNDNSMSESGYIVERQNGVNVPVPNFVTIATVSANETTYTDTSFTTETNYIYRVRGYNSKVNSAYSNEFTITITDVTSENEIPTKYELSQNYPNPFNPSTIIRFSVPEISFVNITIYNLLGEKVGGLINKEVTAGYHEITWNALRAPTGIYLIAARLESQSSNEVHTFTKKAILLK